MFHHIHPLSITNPIASTLRTHITQQDNTLLASLCDKSTHITDPHTYIQTYCDFTPRRTHTSLLPRLKPL
jgi:carboxypeptidase C (cathepsin A)